MMLGHIGAIPAPLPDNAALIGLHSSWDDTNAMRHGIPLVAIKESLLLHLPATSGNQRSLISYDAPKKSQSLIMQVLQKDLEDFAVIEDN